MNLTVISNKVSILLIAFVISGCAVQYYGNYDVPESYKSEIAVLIINPPITVSKVDGNPIRKTFPFLPKWNGPIAMKLLPGEHAVLVGYDDYTPHVFSESAMHRSDRDIELNFYARPRHEYTVKYKIKNGFWEPFIADITPSLIIVDTSKEVAYH